MSVKDVFPSPYGVTVIKFRKSENGTRERLSFRPLTG